MLAVFMLAVEKTGAGKYRKGFKVFGGTMTLIGGLSIRIDFLCNVTTGKL